MKKILVLVSSVFLLFSCTPSKDDLTKKIAELETAFQQKSQTRLDIEAANQLLETYGVYIENYSTDEQIAEVTFKAGELAMNMKNSALAIEYLESVYNNVPNFENREQVLFFLGNVYENQAFDLEMAEKYYTELVEKYPSGKYTNDVKLTLDNLGKTPEEILKKLETSVDSSATDTAKTI